MEHSPVLLTHTGAQRAQSFIADSVNNANVPTKVEHYSWGLLTPRAQTKRLGCCTLPLSSLTRRVPKRTCDTKGHQPCTAAVASCLATGTQAQAGRRRLAPAPKGHLLEPGS